MTIKYESIFIYPFILLLSFIVAIRGDTSDTSTYKFIFDNLEIYSLRPLIFYLTSGVEIGYGYLSYLVRLITDNVEFLFFLISFAAFLALYKSSKMIGANFGFVLLCYIATFFWIHQLIQIRQGLSVVLVYLALFYFLSRQRKRGLLLYLVAVSFHTVSIAAFFLFFINGKGKFKKKVLNNRFYSLLFFLIIAIFLARTLINILPLISSRVAIYSQSAEYASERSFLHPANLRAYLLLIFFYMHFNFFPKNVMYRVLYCIFVFGVGIRVGFYDFLILSGRLGSLFTFSEVFLLPLVISKYKFSIVRILLVFIYFVISMYISLSYQYPSIIEDYFRSMS